MKFLAIDPSINFCGVALFSINELTRVATLEKWDCLKHRRVTGMSTKWRSALAGMVKTLNAKWVSKAHVVAIEEPSRWQASAKSASAEASGNLQKLLSLVDMLVITIEGSGKACTLIPPVKWKGNLPKELTMQRVNTFFGLKLTDDNTADAIGIGVHWLKERNYGIERTPNLR